MSEGSYRTSDPLRLPAWQDPARGPTAEKPSDPNVLFALSI